MNIDHITTIIDQGESSNVEFKESKKKVNKDFYETVCSFLNRDGGEILLGVKDNGDIVGIEARRVQVIKQDIVTTVNNARKINPPVNLTIEEVNLDNKIVLYIYVPVSSQVHKCNARIFDRIEDADQDITDNFTRVSRLYMRKQTQYSENKIFRYCSINDLKVELIEKVRNIVTRMNREHPWNNMNDLKMLKSARLYHKDYATGEKGFSLACILLFGKDETILSVLPHYKTDLILRQKDKDRYDDRADIRTNLIDSYEKIISFCSQYLPDPHYIEGTRRISIRDIILREITSNILIHREYTDPYPAKIIIEDRRIYAENSNIPHHKGPINLNSFSPYPKNPVIARVFKEIGYADELGSGVRNLSKYVNLYSNGQPELIEDDIFKVIIPLKKAETEREEGLNEGLSEGLNEVLKSMLNIIHKNPGIQAKELKKYSNKSISTIDRQIKILKDKNLIERKGSRKTGGYYLKEK